MHPVKGMHTQKLPGQHSWSWWINNANTNRHAHHDRKSSEAIHFTEVKILHTQSELYHAMESHTHEHTKRNYTISRLTKVVKKIKCMSTDKNGESIHDQQEKWCWMDYTQTRSTADTMTKNTEVIHLTEVQCLHTQSVLTIQNGGNKGSCLVYEQYSHDDKYYHNE